MSIARLSTILVGSSLLVGVACTDSRSTSVSPQRKVLTAPARSQEPHDPRYFATRKPGPAGDASAQWIALHPESLATTEFQRSRVLLRPASLKAAQAALELHAVAWGCRDQLVELDEAEPERTERDPDQVTYRRAQGALLEWYRHGPAGLEQGFTVGELPRCAEKGRPLVVRLAATDGWTNAVTADGSRALFRHAGGTRVHYTDAHAVSANGRVHTVRIARSGGDVALEVDTEGVVLPLVIDPLAWTEQQKVVASMGASGDEFGYSVAVKGALLAVGARLDDEKGSEAGAVYDYTRAGVTWGTQKKVVASDGAAGDHFGVSVTNSGTYLAVGADGDDDGGSNAGAVYVFTRAAGTWGTQRKLVAADAAAGDLFGSSVALDGTTLVIGAPSDDDLGTGAGAAYVYTLASGTWTLQQKLVAADADADAGDAFGTSVGISGNTVVVGAPFDSQGAGLAGAAFVFLRTGSTWAQQQKLVAGDASADDYAGTAVSISDNSVAVGAPGDGDKGFAAGAAYIWTRSGATWTAQPKLYATIAATGDEFGAATALSADNLVIGARSFSSASGAVHVFQRSGASWSEITRLLASDPAGNALYGMSVSIDGSTVASGAPGGNSGKGAAYVGALANSSPCSTGTDCDSGNCVEGVCCNTACAGACTSCLASRKASGADGTCGNVKVDTDPRNQCDATAVNGCGTTGVCNGAGACSLFADGTECGAASCPTPTSENAKDSCNGSGSCVVTAATACNRGYLCEAGACHTSCTAGASECDPNAGADYECIDGECKVAQAGQCQVDADCASGHCEDGVCCDRQCEGPCIACTVALKNSGADGVCGPISAETDPREQCDAGTTACDQDGVCDGQGNCRSYAKPQTPCGPTECDPDAGHVIVGQLCDGEGSCIDSEGVACAPFLCSGSVCGDTCESDAGCSAAAPANDYPGAFCNAAGKCQDKAPDGTSCGATNECASGFCVDGFCCNAACDGQCEACAEAGAEGTCVGVQGEPRGDRSACPTAPAAEPCQEVTCDGDADRRACVGYVGSNVVCQAATCTDGLATGTGRCDGAGTCAVDKPKTCDPYRCGADACLTSCENNDDCVEGNTCVEGECRTGSRCSDDNLSVIDSGGMSTSCAPFVCSADKCLTECTSSGHCVSGYACNDDQQCEAVAGPTAGEDSGCGCRAAGGKPRGALLALAGLSFLLLRRRGRRNS